MHTCQLSGMSESEIACKRIFLQHFERESFFGKIKSEIFFKDTEVVS